MKSALPLFAAFTALFLSFTASADSLEQARKLGHVGETANGYIAAVGSPSPGTQTLVSTINSGRKSEYEKIAGRNGQPINVVEKLAAQKIYSSLPAGTHVQNDSGGWTKK